MTYNKIGNEKIFANIEWKDTSKNPTAGSKNKISDFEISNNSVNKYEVDRS